MLLGWSVCILPVLLADAPKGDGFWGWPKAPGAEGWPKVGAGNEGLPKVEEAWLKPALCCPSGDGFPNADGWPKDGWPNVEAGAEGWPNAGLPNVDGADGCPKVGAGIEG